VFYVRNLLDTVWFLNLVIFWLSQVWNFAEKTVQFVRFHYVIAVMALRFLPSITVKKS
jgi:hypothetical protein